MEKVKILIVEDELLIAEDIRMQLINLGYCVSGMAVSYNEALNSIMQDLPDLVMVDINIDGNKDGIELGNFLHNEAEIPFIYLTSHADSKTVDRAKQTNPDAYLLKPFKSENLYISIEIALANATKTNKYNDIEKKLNKDENQDFLLKDCVFIKKDQIFVKVKLNEILFIKSEGNYLDLYTSNGKKHFIRSSMKYFGDFLLNKSFFKCHMSYMVNLNFIDEFAPTFLKIGKYEVPIAKNRKEELLSKMQTL